MGLFGGLLRYVIIGVVIWVLYRVLKSWLKGPPPGREGKVGGPGAGKPREVVDVMVQDPQCGVYLPQHEALRSVVGGQERYFCSEACRDAFLAQAAKNNNPGAQGPA